MPQIKPLAQKLSDQMMMSRYAALMLKSCILQAQTTMLQLQNDIMDDQGNKMFGFETGAIERDMMKLAGQHGSVKALHQKLAALGRKHGVGMPSAPTYDNDYLSLSDKEVMVKLSSVLRR